MKPLLCLLSAPLLALALSGCGTAGAAHPDLVVYNDSTQVIYTITLSTETQSESVSSPPGPGAFGAWGSLRHVPGWSVRPLHPGAEGGARGHAGPVPEQF